MQHRPFGSSIAGHVIWRWVAAAGIGLATLMTGRTAAAQGSGSGFLFQPPAVTLDVRGGYARASAGGDLFSFATDNLTLSRGAFSGPTVDADLAVRLTPRLDLVFGAGYAGASAPSEYRALVDQNNMPIQQTTSLRRVPVTASVRLYLTPRGRSIGRFAWVPTRFAPYVSAGGGAMWYRFRQQGYFVDANDNTSVFPGDFTSSQWTPAAQGAVGADFSLTPRLALTGQAKYLWARATPNQSFSGFNRIDLSGFSTTLGLSVRF